MSSLSALLFLFLYNFLEAVIQFLFLLVFDLFKAVITAFSSTLFLLCRLFVQIIIVVIIA